MAPNLIGDLNSAYSGLSASQTGIEVTGQNIANAGTPGYVREAVDLQAVPGAAQTGLFTSGAAGATAGQGVTVATIAGLGSALLDAQARTSSATAAYSGAQASALSQIESTLAEPGSTGLSARLTGFWSAWQDVSNQPGAAAPVSALLGQAQTVVQQIAGDYQSLQQQWSQTRQSLTASVSQLNTDATQVAQLNGQIRTLAASGGNVNELVGQRNAALTDLATLTGASVTENADHTVNVTIGGDLLVQGTTARAATVAGSTTLDGAATNPVGVQWADQGTPISIGSGSIAGNLSVLAPANAAGNGGAIAETAANLNTLASSLASQVNAVSVTGTTASGATGVSFFGLTGTGPAALGLTVIPTNASGVAVGAPGAGAADGSIADAISQIGAQAGSPDAGWSSSVVALGAQSKSAADQSTLDQAAHAAATTAQASQESVSLDEENMNLIAYQHAYEGSARVMTAIDSMLDQLINHTGLVGLG